MSEPVHGAWRLSLDGPIMSLTLVDGFNSSAVQALHHEAGQRLAAQIHLGLRPPFASIVDLRQWQLITPDSLDALHDMFARMSEVGFTHIAYINSSGKLRQAVLEESWRPFPQVKRHYGQDLKSAVEWLQHAGFVTDLTAAG